MVDFSTKKVSTNLVKQIKESLKKIRGGYGSVEIIVQNHCVTQISTREITKTNEPISTNGIVKRLQKVSV
jgi:hypothetical protein